MDLYDVDEIVYIGGSASLPGLDETLSRGFSESVVTPFTSGTVVGGGIGDPTTILSRGCATQAKLLATLPENTDEEREVKAAFASTSKWTGVQATSKTIGLIFPEDNAEGSLGGQWVPVVLKETPLPARRAVRFEADLGDSEGEKKVGFEVWEVKEGVKITMETPPKLELEDGTEDDDEEEEEEIEIKEKSVEKENLLTSLSLVSKSEKKQQGRWKTKVEVEFIVGVDGAVEVTLREIGGETTTSKIAV